MGHGVLGVPLGRAALSGSFRAGVYFTWLIRRPCGVIECAPIHDWVLLVLGAARKFIVSFT